MGPRGVTEERYAEERYAEEMDELWTGLNRTLARLDRLAAEPERLEQHFVEGSLRRFQYALHQAGEQAYGVQPPEGARTAHAGLAEALAGARDATAEILEALEDSGPDGVLPLVYEWRGALFRVRLARLRLADSAEAEEASPLVEPEGLPSLKAPLAALALVVAGAAALATGATVSAWPIWVAGIVAVAGAVAAYRL